MAFLAKLFSGGVASISASEVQEKLGGDAVPLLLDVREDVEFTSGHISGAKHIPLGELPRRLKELPKDRQIICVCASGARSSSATRQLAAQGFDVLNLGGGMMGWARAGLPVKKGHGK